MDKSCARDDVRYTDDRHRYAMNDDECTFVYYVAINLCHFLSVALSRFDIHICMLILLSVFKFRHLNASFYQAINIRLSSD